MDRPSINIKGHSKKMSFETRKSPKVFNFLTRNTNFFANNAPVSLFKWSYIKYHNSFLLCFWWCFLYNKYTEHSSEITTCSYVEISLKMNLIFSLKLSAVILNIFSFISLLKSIFFLFVAEFLLYLMWLTWNLKNCFTDSLYVHNVYEAFGFFSIPCPIIFEVSSFPKFLYKHYCAKKFILR